MDTSEYMPMFLAEAREHLQELNIAVVSLEENPEDRPTIDEIFRIAHSFKGMSATMGFAAIADLTHEMEEVFELLRQRTGALSHDAVDTVLACLDALSEAVDGIEDDGEERLDPGPLKERLRALVRSGTEDRRQEERRAKDEAVEAERRSGEDRREAERREPEPEAPPAAPEADLDDEELPAELLAAIPDDGSFMLDVKVKLTDDALMPSVRALMVLTALAEHGELVRSVPDQSAVEGFTGQAIRAWLVTQIGETEIANHVVTVSDVADVEVTAVERPTGDTSDAPKPAATTTSAQATESGHRLLRPEELPQGHRLLSAGREDDGARRETASVYSNLGTALFARKKYDEAMEAYQTALKLDPNVFESHNNFGVLLQERNVEERAKYHYSLAKLYAKMDRADLALQYLRKALEEGFKERKKLEEDPEFDTMRDTPEFKELLALTPRVL